MSIKIGAVAMRQTDTIYALKVLKKESTHGGGVLTSGTKTARWIVMALTTAYQKLIIGIFDDRKESVDLLASVAKMLGFTCFFDEFAAKRDEIIAVFPKTSVRLRPRVVWLWRQQRGERDVVCGCGVAASNA